MVNRSKSTRSFAAVWLNQMRSYLEKAEKAGDMRNAYVFCCSLAGGLGFASNLRMVSPKDLKYWEDYITSKSADLEYLLFGPNLEEGRTS